MPAIWKQNQGKTVTAWGQEASVWGMREEGKEGGGPEEGRCIETVTKWTVGKNNCRLNWESPELVCATQTVANMKQMLTRELCTEEKGKTGVRRSSSNPVTNSWERCAGYSFDLVPNFWGMQSFWTVPLRGRSTWCRQSHKCGKTKSWHTDFYSSVGEVSRFLSKTNINMDHCENKSNMKYKIN